MSKRVVVATDGSKAAERAVDFALTMAKMWEAELIAVTVSTNLSPTELRQLAMARKDRDLDAATEELVANILGDVENRAARHGVANVRCVSMSGTRRMWR
jgi:nucleotide-binding universal stress UspA family protein